MALYLPQRSLEFRWCIKVAQRLKFGIHVDQFLGADNPRRHAVEQQPSTQSALRQELRRRRRSSKR